MNTVDKSREEIRDTLRLLLETQAVVYRKISLSSGRVGNYYIDCRRVTTIPHAMVWIGWLVLDSISDLVEISAIGGPTLGADPISAAVAIMSTHTPFPIPMFMIRKEKKAYGLENLIEGSFPTNPGARVVVVDDVISSGESLHRAIQVVEGRGVRVTRVVVLVDRVEGGVVRLREAGYDVRAIFTKGDLGIK